LQSHVPPLQQSPFRQQSQAQSGVQQDFVFSIGFYPFKRGVIFLTQMQRLLLKLPAVHGNTPRALVFPSRSDPQSGVH
jgi:hypothetical protein